MARSLKILLWIIGALVGIVILLWLGLILFINSNKKQFADAITEQINERINGTCTIASIEPTILRDFPDVSFQLKDVVIRDTMWQLHRHDFLNLDEGYIAINLWSAIMKDAFIEKITLSKGTISLYSENDTLTNTHIFKTKKKNDTGKKRNNPISKLFLKDMVFKVVHKKKNKDFNLGIERCDIYVRHNDTGWTAKAYVKSTLNSFAFNTNKGSFMKDKLLDAVFDLKYNTEKQLLTVPVQAIKLDDFRYDIGGEFAFADTPYHFSLDILSSQVPYKNILEILTPAISSKINKIDVNKIDEVSVKVIGKMKYLDTPYVRANFEVKNKVLTIPQGTISNCSFSGYFLDEVVEGKGHGDANSMVAIEQLTGSFYGINFQLDDASVKNLKDPVLRTKLTSRFKLPLLNKVIGIANYSFNNGDAHVNLHCAIPIKIDKSHPPNINGNINFSNASFSYKPRKLIFKKASGVVNFKGTDVNINNVQLQSENNAITLNGKIDKLLNLYYTTPEKVVIDCTISSPKINLNEYVSFLGKRNTEGETNIKGSSNAMTKFAKQLDDVMDESNVNIGVNLKTVTYKTFSADNVKADLQLAQDKVMIQNGHFNHADGAIDLAATVKVKDQSSAFTLDATIQKVDVRKLFRAFNNFGQDAVAHHNIKGNLTAKVNAKGGIKYTGEIVPNSLNGNINFDLNKGELIDFEPLGTIGKIVFFNRDLQHITIQPLSGTLDVYNSNIIIQPMLIQTSAFNIFTEGVYGIPTGTDILIQVPLRNPKKDVNRKNKHMTTKDLKKGLVINLHATDNNTGKVKIKLGKGKKFD